MTIEGKLILKGSTEQVSDKFKKREAVIKTDGQYPQEILVQFTQDKCSLLDAYKIGDSITAHYNLRGKSWTNPEGKTKYFNTIEVWKISGQGSTATPAVESSGDVIDDQSLPF